jgi:hypothetical protein
MGSLRLDISQFGNRKSQSRKLAEDSIRENQSESAGQPILKNPIYHDTVEHISPFHTKGILRHVLTKNNRSMNAKKKLKYSYLSINQPIMTFFPIIQPKIEPKSNSLKDFTLWGVRARTNRSKPPAPWLWVDTPPAHTHGIHTPAHNTAHTSPHIQSHQRSAKDKQRKPEHTPAPWIPIFNPETIKKCDKLAENRRIPISTRAKYNKINKTNCNIILILFQSRQKPTEKPPISRQQSHQAKEPEFHFGNGKLATFSRKTYQTMSFQLSSFYGLNSQDKHTRYGMSYTLHTRYGMFFLIITTEHPILTADENREDLK